MMTSGATQREPRLGLVLSGGGARSAYQAGVIKALSEIAAGQARHRNVVRIITGVSAGGMNAAYLAAHLASWPAAGAGLARLWQQLTPQNVFRTDVCSLGQIGYKWATQLSIGAFLQRAQVNALLDTTPLRQFLPSAIPFERIGDNLARGILDGVAITATDYYADVSVTFVQATTVPRWVRSRRRSEPATLGLQHVLASGAIPLFFPPVQIGNSSYGDGCMRNSAPLSPAIHMGCDKLLVIGVSKSAPADRAPAPAPVPSPSVARIVGALLDSVFLDAIDLDIERLTRINTTLAHVPKNALHRVPLRHIDALVISPSVRLGDLAMQHEADLPPLLRHLVGSLGEPREAQDILSYLLFDRAFCSELVALGYDDCMRRRDEVEKFLFGTASDLRAVGNREPPSDAQRA